LLFPFIIRSAGGGQVLARLWRVGRSTCPQRSRPSASRALGKRAGLRGGRVFVIHLFFIQPLTYLPSFKNKKYLDRWKNRGIFRSNYLYLIGGMPHENL